MAPILSCPKCGNPTSQRSRPEIAERIQEAILMCAKVPEEWVRRFQMLSANMMWLEGELRGNCVNCTVEYAAIEHGDLMVKTQRIALPVDDAADERMMQLRAAQPPSTKRTLCLVIPIDEMRDRKGGGE